MTSHQDGYMLSRDKQESSRLDVQHEMFTALAGGHLLDPTIPLSTVHSVADVGTGTGIWLQQVASLVKSQSDASSSGSPTRFVGFDVSGAQFPQSNDKVHFGGLKWVVHDITKPFPEEFHEVFDVVHVRLLSFALKANVINDAVRNVVRLLKPGGYLQWQEGDLPDIVTTPELKEVKRILYILLQERKARGFAPTISQPLLRALCDLQLDTVQPRKPDQVDLLTFGDTYALRIMQVRTQNTRGHPSSLVSKTASQVIGGGVRGLLKMSVAAKHEALRAADISQRERDWLTGSAKEAEALVDDQCFVAAHWDMEYATYLARRAVVVSMNSLEQGQNQLRYPQIDRD